MLDHCGHYPNRSPIRASSPDSTSGGATAWAASSIGQASFDMLRKRILLR